MLSVAYFSYLAERNPARFPDLARAMGERIEGLSEKDQALAFITGLKKLIKNVGLDQHQLSSYGIQRTDLRRLAENAFHTMGKLFAITPVKLTVDDATAIYERAYA
jgi:alcohol dehydrogenase